MIFEDLSSDQLQVLNAILDSNRETVVLGGPGTGKTTTALWAAQMFLSQPNQKPDARVLFLTFSRTAIQQIAQRAPGVLGKYRDRIEISTFHGLAYRLLRAFGRYAGYGNPLAPLQSACSIKIFGHNEQELTYDDLVPAAITLLTESTRLKKLVAHRWPLVICDEFQDTAPEQWNLLQQIGAQKLLLLGDNNQMIYTFVKGVSQQQFRRIIYSVSKRIDIEPVSHRDPSNAIPALADAVRRRDFQHEAVKSAVRNGVLRIISDLQAGNLSAFLVKEIEFARSTGCRSVGIFAYSNAAVAELAKALDEEGIEHDLIGIPEAHAEALSVMGKLFAYKAGIVRFDDILTGFALFLTSAVRQSSIPPLAQSLVGKGNPLPANIKMVLDELRLVLSEPTNESVNDVFEIAAQAWPKLRMTTGGRVWNQAAQHFARLIRPFTSQLITADLAQSILNIVDQQRTQAMIDFDWSARSAVHVMNFHQAKGREYDAAILIHFDNDAFGKRQEPFEEASRLLYVAITRARRQVTIRLPQEPHPLVAPFRHYTDRTIDRSATYLPPGMRTSALANPRLTRSP